MSNIGKRGIWMFQIGNLGRTGNVIIPDIVTESMVNRATCEHTDDPCPANAKCVEQPNGFCCQCSEGYFGNGHECIENGKCKIYIFVYF